MGKSMQHFYSYISPFNKRFKSLALSGRSRSVLLAFACVVVTACGTQSGAEQSSVNPAQSEVADLQVVDCLLPGQVRRLGNSSYLTPRRPTRTTASDCRIRGGEYVAYDRANYKTALKVWMQTAEAGDADAQANVGEIFERGLGGEPNYDAAFIWYEKAAKQGNARAQFNLGTLYEQGLGVPKSKLLALNWYRKAWGLEEDSLIYQSAASDAKAQLRASLERDLKQKDGQIGLLKKQMAALQDKVTVATASRAKKVEGEKIEQELGQLKGWVADLEKERLLAQNKYDQLPRFREPGNKLASIQQTQGEVSALTLKGMEFGKYYALIIGNQNYQRIDDLLTPYSDAQRAKDILEKQYGFNVTMLLDADNTTVMKAINELNKVVTEKDNLLIFYAGHGSRIRNGDFETGYWLPVNANMPPDDTYWIPNEFVTRHLSRLPAKRVIVVADSCYAGLLSSAPGYLFVGDKPNYNEEYIRYKLPKKSRLLLSSGGDQPVLDNAGSGHSVFARAFLDVLEKSSEVISGPELFLAVRKQVKSQAEKFGFEQIPEFKAIKGAGHEVGDFFFVRK